MYITVHSDISITENIQLQKTFQGPSFYTVIVRSLRV